jgi:hypothetical protein
MSSRCLYTKIKESYDNATLKKLLKTIPEFKKFLIWYFILLIVAVIPLISLMWRDTQTHTLLETFTPIFLASIPVLCMIYILLYILPNILISYYSTDKYNKLKTYKRGWKAARYQLFKESLKTIETNKLDDVYGYIHEEKDFPKETIWDHKLFVTFMAFLMIAWGGIIKELAKNNLQSILMFVIILSLLIAPMLWMFLSSVQTDNEKHKELKLFLSWYECELSDRKKETKYMQHD